MARSTAQRPPSRGKLKIFLGYAPGVGKTYKMLELARELASQPVDVVVGYVETHNRYDVSALVLGLEILPRRAVAYRGGRLEEFDLGAALARRPQVLILDDLAHTNAPGGLHDRRWQDVLDLVDAGIEVQTTLNVHELESLNDVVAQITGIRVRETVPDTVLERAADIELVDCPPEELTSRVAEGKVRFVDQSRRAAAPFFQHGALLGLRELALRTAAQQVGDAVLELREAQAIQSTWPTAERIMVCVGPAPSSARLVRAASRMAASLRAPWITVSVDDSRLTSLSEADRERVESHLVLAESLGAEAVRRTGDRKSEVLLEYARRRNVSRILVGKPTHSRLRDLIRGSLLDEIVRGSQDIDIQVIAGEADAPAVDGGARPARRGRPWAYAATAGLVALAAGLGALTRSHLAAPDFVMLFMLVIAVAAALFGRGPSLVASVLSVFAYNFFFVPPLYTPWVADERHLLTFGMMFAVGLVTSAITLHLRRQESDARTREEHTGTLYSLSRDLSSALDETQAALVVAQHASELLGGGAVVLLPDEHGGVAPRARSGAELPFGERETSAARWAFDHGRFAGHGTQTIPESRATCVPLRSGPGPESLGVLAFAAPGPISLGIERRHFLEAFARQAALALERARLAEEAKRAALRARTEQMRSSLLSAVSHDLRTPLAAITGAATALRDETGGLAESQRSELLETVCEEADRLERLVRNLLDMTQLEAGALLVKREWVLLEEVVGSALARLEGRLGNRPILTDLPTDLPLISVDPVLLEQVFVNLLENARKYTPDGGLLEIRAHTEAGATVIEVCDRGPGLPEVEGARLFDKFVRGSHPGIPGVGLGLAICRGIMEAHQGTITAENREGGGAVFRLTVPSLVQPPSVPAEVDPAEGEARP